MAKTMKATIELGGKLDGSLLKTMSSAEKQMAALRKSTAAIHKVAGVAARAAGVAIAAAGAATVKIVKDSVEVGKQFDSSMAQVAATMGKSVEEIGDLRQFALDMGKSTMFSASQAADALNYMALAGYDAETSMKMLPNVLNLAAAGGMELADASDMVTDASSALGLSLDETSALVDKMAKASSKSNTSVAQLGEALLVVGGTAKSMKGGTTEISQALGILADNGIKGAEGGTALRNVLLGLSSDKFYKTFGELGVSAYDAEGNMRSLEDVFLDMNDAMADMTVEEKTAALSSAFNKVDLKSLNALLGTNKERWEELSAAIDDSSGAAEQMAKTQLDNLAGDITYFQSAMEGAQITISDALTPALREFVQFGTEEIGDLTEVLQTEEFQTFASNVAHDITDAAKSGIRALDEFKDGFAEGFDAAGFMDSLSGVSQAIGGAFGDGSEAPAAKGFGAALASSLNLAADAIEFATPLIGGAASAVKFLADNAGVVLPVVVGVAGAFVAINAVSGVAGVITAVGGALGMLGVTGTAAGAGLTATGGGARTAGAAAAGSVGQLLALGGAVLMIGGGVALAALGLGIMAQGAIALASAGGGAIGVMVGMVAGLFALGAAAYFAGPAFTAGAPGILAFGAAVLMVGGGVALATSGIAALAAQLPLIATFGMAGGAGLMALGAGLMLAGAGGLVAGAGLLVATPALAAFSAVAAPASAGIGLLSAAVGALAGPIVESGDAIGTMGWGMQAMADNATAAATGLTTLSAASAAASAPIALSAPSMSALGTAAASSVSGTQAASAGLNAMMLVMMMLPGAVGAGVGAFSAFAGGVSGAMQSAKSSVSSACSAMQREVNGMNLSIPTIRVNALPHFSMSGEFNAETKSVPTVSVSYYAQGGFTDGPVAIAGEAGQEAVISFDPRYRDQNIMYWLMAGQMLGMLNPFAQGGFTDGTATPLSIEIASSTGSLATAASATGTGSSSGSSVDFGGVTFAPQITVSGQGGQDVISQLRQAQDEFRDMLEEIADDWRRDYAPVF